ncbi:MAG: response regulator [Desulfuromonadales bacterium]
MITDNVTAPLILVVEDDDSHAELICRSFDAAQQGYRVTVVGTLGAAKSDIEVRPPNLVLTDYHLPDGDGKELVTLSGNVWPVVMMTSQGNEQLAVEAMKAGALDYVVKSPESFAAMSHLASLALREWKLLQERRSMYESVSQAKHEWEQTFDAVPDLIAIIDTSHTIIRVNRAMAERCCVTAEELSGRKCHEVMHSLNIPPSFCPYSKMLQDHLVHNEVVEEKTLHGIFDVTVSPLFNSDGKVTAAVHVARDVSERKKAEESLLQNNELLRLALDASSDGIWDWDVPNNSIYWSPRCYTMLGYEPDAFVVTFKKWKELLHPDDREAASRTVRQMMNLAEGNFTVEFRIATKGGGWCWIMWRGKPTSRNEKGEILRFVGTNTNISDRKKDEEERHRLEQQFQQTQKLESLGVLAGGIAHDFNNILSIILGHCFMSRDATSEEAQRTHLLQIEGAANRAADLCRQMLAYAGKNPLVQNRLDVRSMVNDITKMLQSAIKKNVAIELDLTSDQPEIMGDASQIQQIAMNLIINAAEAIGDDNGTIRITLATIEFDENRTDEDFLGREIPAGRYICLEVVDTGCGMDEITQKRIFEPFYTTKFTGRGLGMSAILGIIKSHQGALQLTSVPGEGTTFKVFLPLSEAMTEGDIPVPVASVVEPGCGTILLVDDEEALRSIGAELLEAMGYTALTASNGARALEIFRQRSGEIDLLMLDLIMPELGGVATYHEVRKLSATVPVVICSGYGVEEVLEIIETDSAAGFMQKPYRPDELRKLLTSRIEAYRVARNAAAEGI